MKLSAKEKRRRIVNSADGFQQMDFSRWRKVQKLKRRRIENQQMKRSLSVEATSCGNSADGLVGDDVIGDVIQSQDSAGSLLSRRKWKRRRIGSLSSRKLQCNQQMLLELAIAKRCRLHKLIRQRFAHALKIQMEDFALLFSADEATVHPVATQSIQSQEDSGEAFDDPVASNSSIQS
ncbi:hypothetical protein F511_37208 [Dorcoceras hygrometricum]|uniref:Uncharacterized protein n=1 Tax=Dorcoceras hygrometricum TaxID=472368 RepID=A0A2Z7BYI1_9LAMI|nr:hypothetical protein F511_37208 [Dorcoceras hygrometricum]